MDNNSIAQMYRGYADLLQILQKPVGGGVGGGGVKVPTFDEYLVLRRGSDGLSEVVGSGSVNSVSADGGEVVGAVGSGDVDVVAGSVGSVDDGQGLENKGVVGSVSGGEDDEFVDAKDESVSEGSVVFPDGMEEELGRVRGSVVFGGLSDFAGQPPVLGKGDFFSSWVRSEDAKKFCSFVAKNAECEIPKPMRQHLALVRFTRGTVPDAFVDGRDRMRVFELAGDHVLKLMNTARGVAAGYSVSRITDVHRGKQSNSTHISEPFRKEFVNHVVWASGINLQQGSAVVFDVLEAVLGVLAMYRPLSAVAKFAEKAGVLSRVA